MAMAAAANSGGAVSPPPVGNPELRIAVHAPLRHMGPSGLVPGAQLHMPPCISAVGHTTSDGCGGSAQHLAAVLSAAPAPLSLQHVHLAMNQYVW
jgi:hypothetical protein